MDLKFLDKLDIFSKTTIVSIAVLMPFWYASIYLFNRQLFTDSELYLKIVFSFCFAITWYFVNVMFLLIDQAILKREIELGRIFKISSFLSVLYLSLLITIHYKGTSSLENFLFKDYIYLTTFYVLSISVDKIFSKRR
jgi:hypothetical protein